VVEARIRLCEDRFQTIRRPIVVLWGKKRRKYGPHRRISQTDQPEPDRLLYNRDTIPSFPEVTEELRFAVLARTSTGELAGGIRASAFWGYLSIELLWLSEPARGGGIGTRLVRAAEAFAVQHGFQYARVETTSFQAKPFYEKLGYEVFGVLDDFPPGYRSYYLKKRL
jgi:GNAT superfamily N-acetyltransferase